MRDLRLGMDDDEDKEIEEDIIATNQAFAHEICGEKQVSCKNIEEVMRRMANTGCPLQLVEAQVQIFKPDEREGEYGWCWTSTVKVRNTQIGHEAYGDSPLQPYLLNGEYDPYGCIKAMLLAQSNAYGWHIDGSQVRGM